MDALTEVMLENMQSTIKLGEKEISDRLHEPEGSAEYHIGYLTGTIKALRVDIDHIIKHNKL